MLNAELYRRVQPPPIQPAEKLISHEEIEAQTKEFLARGGRIKEVPTLQCAPPIKTRNGSVALVINPKLEEERRARRAALPEWRLATNRSESGVKFVYRYKTGWQACWKHQDGSTVYIGTAGGVDEAIDLQTAWLESKGITGV